VGIFFGDFWSAREAVGLVMATGNVGNYLLLEPEEVNTFLSIDAGLSWAQMTSGSTVYEFGSHGSILAMVANEVPVTTMYYSLNMGASWNALNFTSSPVVVISIFTTSASHSKFVMFARQGSNVIYFGLDFTQVIERACTPNDYEDFSLANDGAPTCILGRTTIYNRKKPTIACESPVNTNPIKSVTNCTCTASDFECDLGFERTTLSSHCVQVPGETGDTPCLNGYYYKSSGYRKIPGDTCVNSTEHYSPVLTACNGTATSSTSTSSSTTTGSNGILTTGSNISGNGQMSSSGMAGLVIGGIILFIVAGLLGILIGRKWDFIKTAIQKRRNQNVESGFTTKLQMMDEE